jgi:hypothetical protein
MKLTLIRLLLFFYLSSAYLGATHIHHKAMESVDCKVHILVKNLNSGDALDSSFELLGCGGCFKSIAFNLDYFIVPLIKGFDAQAPPLFF